MKIWGGIPIEDCLWIWIVIIDFHFPFRNTTTSGLHSCFLLTSPGWSLDLLTGCMLPNLLLANVTEWSQRSSGGLFKHTVVWGDRWSGVGEYLHCVTGTNCPMHLRQASLSLAWDGLILKGLPSLSYRWHWPVLPTWPKGFPHHVPFSPPPSYAPLSVSHLTLQTTAQWPSLPLDGTKVHAVPCLESVAHLSTVSMPSRWRPSQTWSPWQRDADGDEWSGPGAKINYVK